jgi:phosphohistidine phosphatase
MFLHLLRHAHAGDASSWAGPDATRPLTDKGRSQSERLGRFLAVLGFETEAIVTSPLVRALQTAEIVADLLGTTIAVDDRLGGGTTVDDVEAILRDHGSPTRPVLVGHDPDMTELVSILSGADVQMRKGSFARIEIDARLQQGTGTLRWLIPPDALKLER